MSAYVLFDVEIRDPACDQAFSRGVEPALEAAGARGLARGGAHEVCMGGWTPRRIVPIESPSVSACEAFDDGPVYPGLKAVRDEASSSRRVSVEGLDP